MKTGSTKSTRRKTAAWVHTSIIAITHALAHAVYGLQRHHSWATAMEWFLHGLPVGGAPWMEVRQVIGELGSLHDVLCSPTWPGKMEVEYHELGFSDWTGVETLVRLHRGRPWILAANTQFDPMVATFSNLPEGLGDRLEVVGENRQVSIKDGAFSDRFQPYEVHVYSSAT